MLYFTSCDYFVTTNLYLRRLVGVGDKGKGSAMLFAKVIELLGKGALTHPHPRICQGQAPQHCWTGCFCVTVRANISKHFVRSL